ncbi:MAG: DGQHR domain-containing protein [Flavobacterium sp.]|nr:DGQHR domain-containing protein [Flavobacterium sp.]
MKLILPTLRGKMGDWMYYVTLLPFKEIAKRISLADEIHKDKGLNKMIQRKVTNRTKEIVNYLRTQEQRFFNSLILGIYGGSPQWQEIDIEKSSVDLTEEQLDYLNRTFGILTLNGEEKIFAIDGQHRSKAIKDAIVEDKNLLDEEVAVIFVAHRTTPEGEIRTRRLFSTLNRYAKPVSISEIIALDEEDNCAIITRNIVEYFQLLKGKILFNQNRSISQANSDAFTNIIVLYDIVKILLTNTPIFGIKTNGEEVKNYTKKRENDKKIKNKQEYVESIFTEAFEKIPAIKKFLETNSINRGKLSTSLLFKPIGQNVMFSVLKICIDNNLKNKAFKFFAENDFSLKNPTWRKVFYDEETGNIRTEKSLQKFAVQIILLKIGIKLKLTQKDKEVHANFNIVL